MKLLPDTLHTDEAKIRKHVAKIFNVHPFDERILQLTYLQMVWIIKSVSEGKQ